MEIDLSSWGEKAENKPLGKYISIVTGQWNINEYIRMMVNLQLFQGREVTFSEHLSFSWFICTSFQSYNSLVSRFVE